MLYTPVAIKIHANSEYKHVRFILRCELGLGKDRYVFHTIP